MTAQCRNGEIGCGLEVDSNLTTKIVAVSRPITSEKHRARLLLCRLFGLWLFRSLSNAEIDHACTAIGTISIAWVICAAPIDTTNKSCFSR